VGWHLENVNCFSYFGFVQMPGGSYEVHVFFFQPDRFSRKDYSRARLQQNFAMLNPLNVAVIPIKQYLKRRNHDNHIPSQCCFLSTISAPGQRFFLPQDVDYGTVCKFEMAGYGYNLPRRLRLSVQMPGLYDSLGHDREHPFPPFEVLDMRFSDDRCWGMAW